MDVFFPLEIERWSNGLFRSTRHRVVIMYNLQIHERRATKIAMLYLYITIDVDTYVNCGMKIVCSRIYVSIYIILKRISRWNPSEACGTPLKRPLLLYL